MPITVNGIGTTYYGKKNLKSYSGLCEFCRRPAELQEYETRLWFVVFLVPVIPLGRKQILGYCGICQRHRALPLGQWEKLKEEAIAAETQKFSATPDDPQTALNLLQTLSGFSRFEEAEKLAQGIQAHFGDDADVQHRLGQWHDFRNRPAEAQQCYRAALKLDPQHAGARCGVALALMGEGRPDDARALIKAPPEVSPRQDAGLYVALATAYQQANRHDDALDVLQVVLAAYPKLRQDKNIRKLARTSERHAPERAPLVPRVPPYRRGAFIAAAAVLVVLGAVAGANLYLAGHRTLHLVNGFRVPVDLQLDDRAPVTLSPNSRQTVTIPEGSHWAAVRAGGKELRKDQFHVTGDFFGRFARGSVFVVNAGAGALLMQEKVTYAVNPVAGGWSNFYANMPYHEFHDIDFAFAPYPETVQLEGGKPTTKSRVSVVDIAPGQIFQLNPGMVAVSQQLRFVETHLQMMPDDKALLQTYVERAMALGRLDQARDFLATGLNANPVRIEWHRMADWMCRDANEEAALRKRYADGLARDPGNAALLYLAGRLETSPASSAAYFDRSIAADPASPYPWMAKAFLLEQSGDLAGAKEALARAVELRPDDADFSTRLYNLRFALGEYAALEQDVRRQLEAEPLRLDLETKLLDLLAASGRMREARAACERYVQNLAVGDPATESQRRTATALVRLQMLYLEDKLPQYLQAADDPALAEWASYFRYQANLELGQYDQAVDALAGDTGASRDAFTALQLTIAYRMAGQEDKAVQWQTKACELLDQGMAEQRRVADLLRKAPAVTKDEIYAISVDSPQKAILIVALAQRMPDERPELAALAEKLNYGRGFPHRFLGRAVAALGETDASSLP
jgi:Flp pilus assembly protein TadD